MFLPIILWTAAALVLVPVASGKIPLFFEKNQGQTHASVDFLSRGGGYTLFLHSGDAVVKLPGSTVRMHLKGSLPNRRGDGIDLLPGVSHYPELGVSGVRQYQRVLYRGIYRGVDMLYHTTNQQLEFDFVVAPGANSEEILMSFGQDVRPRILSDGSLRVENGFHLKAPAAFQFENGRRIPVKARYRLRGSNVGFAVGPHRADLPLIIDPILSYSTYFGGSSAEVLGGLGVDAAGSPYLIGATSSVDFPTTPGAPGTANTKRDCFVAKLNPAGTALVYATYISAKELETERKPCVGAVNPAGDFVIRVPTDIASTPDAPTTPGLKLMRLRKDGSGFVWIAGLESSYSELAIRPDGGAYVAGIRAGVTTEPPPTPDPYFPPGSAPFLSAQRFSAINGALSWTMSRRLWGRNDILDSTTDSTGNLILAATTNDQILFPVTQDINTLVGTVPSASGVHILKIGASAGEILYSSRLGFGLAVQAIAVGPNDEIWAAGDASAILRTTAVVYDVRSVSGNAGGIALMRLSAAADAVRFATHVANSGTSGAVFVAVGADGEAVVGGAVAGPTSSSSFQPFPSGGRDIYLVALDANGAFRWSSWLGGSGNEDAAGLATAPDGNIFAAGTTTSTDYPAAAAFREIPTGESEVFLARIGNDAISCTYAATSSLTTAKAAGDSGSVTVQVNNGCAWSVSADVPWIVPRVGSGGTGPASVPFTVSGNPSASPRKGNLKVGGKSLEVTQPGSPCNVSVTPLMTSFSYSVNMLSLTIDGASGCPLSPSSNVPWIVFDSASSSESFVNFRILENTTFVQRTGTVTVAGKGLTITQAQRPCRMSLSRYSLWTGGAGVKEAITITSECPWTAQSDSSWVQVYPLSGAGDGMVTVTVFPNYEGERRTAILAVGQQILALSQESSKGTPDERFIGQMYFSAFGRVASPAEVASHIASNRPRQELVNLFLTTPEFTNGAKFVAGLYVGILGRDAEYGGWMFQRNAMAQSGATPHGLVTNFLNSAEFGSKYGVLTNPGFVRLLYRQVLGREASQAEVDFQVAHLKDRVNLAVAFLTSEEYKARVGPRLTGFLLHALLLQRGPAKAELDSRASQIENGTPLTTVIAEMLP